MIRHVCRVGMVLGVLAVAGVPAVASSSASFRNEQEIVSLGGGASASVRYAEPVSAVGLVIEPASSRSHSFLESSSLLPSVAPSNAVADWSCYE